MPKRIQRQRTKGWRMPEGAVYVGRPTKWGNPYTVGQQYFTNPLPYALPTGPGVRQSTDLLKVEICQTKAQCVRWFKEWLLVATADLCINRLNLSELCGKDLACWCPLDKPCHADVLLELANSNAGGSQHALMEKYNADGSEGESL